MEKPLVSVNICTLNRSNLIEKAIKSALEQDYPNLEVVVSDSGSDNTEEIIQKIAHDHPQHKIKYFKNDKDGISQNRNFAFSKSNGKYIAVLDSDDYWISPTKISQQVSFLEKNKDHTLVGTNAIIVDSDDQKIGEIINKTTNEELQNDFLLKNHFVHSSTLFRKDVFIKYDESISIWEDYELFLRFGRKSKVANLQEKMTAYKKHDGNVSTKNKVRGVITLANILQQNKKYYPKYKIAVVKNWMRMLRAILTF